MSGDGVIDLPITGQVDAALIRGLIDLGEALKSASTKTEESGAKAERAVVSWSSFTESARRAADTFNEVHQAITTQVAIINGLIDGVTSLAAEQARLDSTSAALGLDMDEAAASAGRFADEIDAARVAGEFHTRQIELTQPQINALFRVAGAHAQELGVSVGQAADQLTTALVRGREGGLERFGQSLAGVAGQSHTVEERLQVLVRQALEVAQGTDDAASSMERFRDTIDDAKRAAASAFVGEFDRLSQIAAGFDSANTSATNLNTTMERIGRTLAAIATRSYAGLRTIGSAFDVVGNYVLEVTGQVRDRSGTDEAVRNFTRRLNALEGLSEAAPFDGTAPASSGEMTFTPAEAGITSARTPTRRTSSGGASAAVEARKEELAKLADIRSAEQRARQEADLRTASLRQTTEARERERQAATRDFNSWLAQADARLQAEKQQEVAKRDRERDEEKRRDTGNRLSEYFTRQMNDANTMADVVEAAYSRMTGAASAHFAALVTGKETAAQALQGFVHDTLTAFAELSAQQALYELAKGLAALFLNPAEAAAHFGAAALFGGIAAGAGALSQAVPAVQSSGGGSPAGSAAGPNRTSADRRAPSGESAAPIVVNYYAPVIGGREVTSAEVGVRLGRYDDAAQRTRVQQRAA